MRSTRPIPLAMPISLLEFFGIVICNLFFALVFGYFVFRLDKDPESCMATTENDHNFLYAFKKGLAVKEEEDEAPKGKISEDLYIDVGQRFRGTFEVLFVTHVVSIVCAFMLVTCNPRVAR